MSGNSRIWHGEREREVYELYSESLQRLTFNARPVISNLTELAYDYSRDFAPLIVKIIEERTRHVAPDVKLPHIYLIDSIIKNHSDPYCALFQQNIVSLFGHVFEYGRESVRLSLHKLRNTWNDHFAFPKLNQLDKHVQKLDPNWPIQADRSRASRSASRGGAGATAGGSHQGPPPVAAPGARPAAVAPAVNPGPTRVHLNPNFLKKTGVGVGSSGNTALDMELKKKEMELQRLKEQKEELAKILKQQAIDKELEEARKQVELQKAMIEKASIDTSSTTKTAAATGAVTTTLKQQQPAVKVCKQSILHFVKKILLSFPILRERENKMGELPRARARAFAAAISDD